MPLAFFQREEHGKLASAAGNALDADAPAVRFHDRLADGEAKAGALETVGGGRPEILVEDTGEFVGRDPYPGVAHLNQQTTVAQFAMHVDRPAPGCELHRVADQVG